MCGRYVRRSDKQRIISHFRVADPLFDIPPNYNVAPSTMQPTIRLNADTGEREILMMRWGLIPSWYKDPKHLGLSTINAKAESLLEKPLWRQTFKKRRCLIAADGFLEWKRIDAKTKQPYAFALNNDEPFAFAGLWERWKQPDGTDLDSFAIVTTDPNELVAAVHNRMPVILEPQDYSRWLTRVDEEPPPVDLLRPFDAEKMKSWKVSKEVGNVRNNDASLLVDIGN